MKIFLFKVLVFFLGMIVLDVAIGHTLDFINRNIKGGELYRDNYICNKMSCDVLLLGSSRCEHHYNPIIIEDSLKLTCYNAGQSGNGIILAYARYLMISERKKPSLVVLDINPEFDLLSTYDNHRYLGWLKNHFEKKYVQDIIFDIDNSEKIKMMSYCYRFNSSFI